MEHSSNRDRQIALKQHAGYSMVFQQGILTFGFVAPMVGYPDSPIPDLSIFDKIVKQADEGGIDIIWLRDVPFWDPNFGDLGQLYDPMVYGGYIAATTKRIAIGTAGIVLPLRDPLIVAKQAVTLDKLSNGRFILGLASGDRPIEYPAFGSTFENRIERFREAKEVIQKVTEQTFPAFSTEYYGKLDGTIDLLPKTQSGILPIIAIGRAGQSLEWIGENMDGWIWHGENARNIHARISQWKQATVKIWKPYGYSHFLDLAEDPNMPVNLSGNFIKGGRNGLIQFWQQQQQQGLAHLALNPKPSRRPAEELIQELIEFIIPAFR